MRQKSIRLGAVLMVMLLIAGLPAGCGQKTEQPADSQEQDVQTGESDQTADEVPPGDQEEQSPADEASQEPEEPDFTPIAVVEKYDMDPFGLAGKSGEIRIVSVEGQPFNEAIQVHTKELLSNRWDLQIIAHNLVPVEQGDNMVVRFYIRCVEGKEDKAKTEFLFEQGVDPWTKSIEKEVEAGKDWQMFQFSFTPKESYQTGEANLSFRVGYEPQVIEIGGIELINYKDQTFQETASIQIQKDKALQVLQDAAGGNFIIQFNSTSKPNDAEGNFNFKTLKPRYIRMGIPMDEWEPTNDNEDTHDFNWDKFIDAGKNNLEFQQMQIFKEEGIEHFTASVWHAPDWMVENPEQDSQRVIKPELYDEAVESITAWLVHARDKYGVEFEYVSFNESLPGLGGDGGYHVRFPSPEAYAEFIKKAGKRFAENGLKTKWLLGDTHQSRNCLLNAKVIYGDEEARPYLGPLAYHSWDTGTADSYLVEIGDWAHERNIPVWVTEMGHDANLWAAPSQFETWNNALRLAEIYNRTIALSRAEVVMYWEMMKDYPLLSDYSVPYPAFYIIHQLGQYFPQGSQVVASASSASDLRVFAAENKDDFSVHLVNRSGNVDYKTTLNGLPKGTYYHIRSSESENSKLVETYTVEDGTLELKIPSGTINILTTIKGNNIGFNLN